MEAGGLPTYWINAVYQRCSQSLVTLGSLHLGLFSHNLGRACRTLALNSTLAIGDAYGKSRVLELRPLWHVITSVCMVQRIALALYDVENRLFVRALILVLATSVGFMWGQLTLTMSPFQLLGDQHGINGRRYPPLTARQRGPAGVCSNRSSLV